MESNSLTEDEKKKLVGALLFRFKKLYTPLMSLCVYLDPRRWFKAGKVEGFGKDLFSTREQNGLINYEEALACLRGLIKGFSITEQATIQQQFHDLTAGRLFLFDTNADDEARGSCPPVRPPLPGQPEPARLTTPRCAARAPHAQGRWSTTCRRTNGGARTRKATACCWARWQSGCCWSPRQLLTWSG